ncbi:hypothetical protein C8R46DRAFT_394889 [Mycena filopes]|nr:hypothetical protein C8R46DRAFT_394889 [Mycena filopes]
MNSWAELSDYYLPPGVIPASYATSASTAAYSCKQPSPSPPTCFTRDTGIVPRLLKRLETFIAFNELGSLTPYTKDSFDRIFDHIASISLTSQDGTTEIALQIQLLLDSLWKEVEPSFSLTGFRPRLQYSQKGDYNITLESKGKDDNETSDGSPPKKKVRYSTAPRNRTIVSGAFGEWKADPPIHAHGDYFSKVFEVLPGGPCEDGAAMVKQAGLQLQSYQVLVDGGKGVIGQNISSTMQIHHGILFAPSNFLLFERAIFTDVDDVVRPALLLSPLYATGPSQVEQVQQVAPLLALWFAMTIPSEDIRHANGHVTRGVPFGDDIDIASLADANVLKQMRDEIARQRVAEDEHLQMLTDLAAERRGAKLKAKRDSESEKDGGGGGKSTGGDGIVRSGFNHLRLWFDTPGLHSPAHHMLRTSSRTLAARLQATTQSPHNISHSSSLETRPTTPDGDDLTPCPEPVLTTADLILSGVIWDANVATVYRGLLKPQKIPVVLKTYPCDHLEGLVSEVTAYEVLASADAPVPRLLGVFDDARGQWTGLILEDVGKTHCHHWHELESRERAQIYGGLVLLHTMGVQHGDVAPRNVIQSEDGRWRWVDLGLARTGHACLGKACPELVAARGKLKLSDDLGS